MSMLHNHNESHVDHMDSHPQKPWYQTLRGLSTAGLLAILGYYLWTEHRAHVIMVLPFAFFLICPLMHLFHGHDHGGHEMEPVHVHDDKSKGDGEGI